MLKFSPIFLLSDTVGETQPQVEKRLEMGDFSRYLVLFLMGDDNKVELIPTLSYQQKYYQKKDFLCFGVATTQSEAEEILAGLYKTVFELTGALNLRPFLQGEVV